MEFNKIFNEDCRETLKRLPNDCIDLIVTSPPYNIGLCHSDDTEILTNKGWKKYTEIFIGESVPTVNINTLEIEYHPIKNIYVYDSADEMINIYKQRGGIDVLVSKNHNLLIKKRTRWNDHLHKWKLIRLKDIDCRYFKFLTGGLCWKGTHPKIFEIKYISNKLKNGKLTDELAQIIQEDRKNNLLSISALSKKYNCSKSFVCYLHKRKKNPSVIEINMKVWVEFLGWYISEGNCGNINNNYKICISQVKKENISKIRECLNKLPFSTYEYSKNGVTQFIITNKSLYYWIVENIGKYSYEKKIPDFIRYLDCSYIKLFMTAYIGGDGNISSSNRHIIFTTSKQIADVLLELELKIGNSTALKMDCREDRRICYSVIGKEKNNKKSYIDTIIDKETDINLKKYNGKIWCIGVQNNTFITRRNGYVGIHGNSYDTHNDRMRWDEYWKFTEEWLQGCYRVLKDDGRICVNHYISFGSGKRGLEVGVEQGTNQIDIDDVENGCRVAPAMEIHRIAMEIGYRHHSVAVWYDRTLAKKTAWGSYLSPSSPYISSPNECILFMYKNNWKKKNKGVSTITKEDFVKLTRGVWDIKTETRGLTIANFPVALPLNCINLLTYEGDVVYDPFMGSATTALACLTTNRKYIGSEISKKYCEIAEERLQKYIHNDETIKKFF